MDLEELQKTLDKEKWIESEKIGRDLCGEMPYCVNCRKEVENPCAKAYSAFYLQPKTKKRGGPKKR